MKERKRQLLIVDDEQKFARVLGREVEAMGYDVVVVHDASGALTHLEKHEIDVALLDIRMPGLDGMTALREIRALPAAPEVIMMTGHATVETAIEAMKVGAYDYLTKPCKLEELEVLIQKALEKRDAVVSSRGLRRYLGEGPPSHRIVGQSGALAKVLGQIERIAQATDVPVLITGESGTGKELIAREIHRRSPLHEEAFVALNCAVLQSTLLESELFGHEKGAFTGAVQRKLGLFEVARGGTLFLDEVGEVDEQVQAKLLRAVQFGEVRRVGGTATLEVAVRIVAATNRDLEKAIAEGRFRDDLFYRLNVVQIHVPPLRERPEDIQPLAEHFLACYGGASPPRLATQAREQLALHAWPGNVRELENFIRRLLIFREGDEITAAQVADCFDASTRSANVPSSLLIEDVEREHILRVLKLCGGNKTETAQRLGIALKTLYNKLNAYREVGFEA